jgi:RimJ/RimL family protein N-acetyltransferase
MRRHQPSLETERLRLRPFLAEDAPAVQGLAGAREIADTALSIPHPYSLAAVKAWIAGQAFSFQQNTSLHFAIELRESGELIGAIELAQIDPGPAQAELRFWVGKAWWGQGYASEAAREIIRYGFESLSLNRIYAHFLSRNPRSGQLLRRLRMKKEGVLRQRARKWDAFEDVILYAIVRDDLTAKRKPARRKRQRSEPPRRPRPRA